MKAKLARLVFRKKNATPVYLIHSITERCNARCTHCFVDKDQKKQELTPDEVRKFCRSFGGNLYHVALSGGEPTLRPDLPEIARAYFEESSTQVIRISTNGGMPDRLLKQVHAILELESCRGLVVEISIDGLRATHNKVRLVKGLFEKAVESYHRLEVLGGKFSNLSLNVNVTVCKSNEHELESLHRYLKDELGITNLSMTLTRGRPDDIAELDVDLDQYEGFVRSVESEMLKGNRGYAKNLHGYLVDAQNVLARRRILKTARENRFISTCYAGSLAAVLESDGKLRPCELRPEIFGNIRDRPATELWKSQEAEAFRGTCDSCHCTHECFVAPNIVFNPRYSVQLLALAAWIFIARIARRVFGGPTGPLRLAGGAGGPNQSKHPST